MLEPHSRADALRSATEAAALTAAVWVGCGDKEAVDRAAVDALRTHLNALPMDGVVIVGEGEKDQAPMLGTGERLGTGEGPRFDIAVDPVDGTGLAAAGLPGALSLVAIAERGSMFDPGPCFYMNKIVVGPRGRGAIDIRERPSDNLREVAAKMKMSVTDLRVMVIDRPRSAELIAEIHEVGAQVVLFTDGDVVAALSTAWPTSGVDVFMSIGGTPEGVITAAALKGLGGEIQGMLHAPSQEVRRAAEARGYDFTKVLTTNDLVASDDCTVIATGVTDGALFHGVRPSPGGSLTQSLVLQSRPPSSNLRTTTHAD